MKRKLQKVYDFNYKKIQLKKGSNVQIISGDYKNQLGEVLVFNRKTGLVVVSEINIKKRAVKKTNDKPGHFTNIQHPIHVSNLKVLNPEGNFVSLRKIKKIKTE